MNIACSAPALSAYNFMRCLFAALAKEKNMIIDKAKIVDKIFDFKRDTSPDDMFIFDDIEFRDSINSVVSYDINEGINNLQTLGVIGKLNPTYEKIVICLTESEADDILGYYDANIRDAMEKLASSFGE